MLRLWSMILMISAVLTVAASALAENDGNDLTRKHWFEARTAHLSVYSCGTVQEVYKVAGRLEQFRTAYGLLAGAQSLTSPPIIVMAFPSLSAMQPFLPQYQGKAENLSGFFKRSADENLIVLGLTGTNTEALDTIYHEYTHLLLRHNDLIWPVWLQEGMAEMYSTFEATGRGVRFGKPIEAHLWVLAHGEFMPLQELLNVKHDSPQYNEQEHQGMFYAESWLLTHFLSNGDNPTIRARFRDYTPLLRAGQGTVQAFTNALRMPLPTIEAELRRYLARGQFESIAAVVPVDLSAPQPISTRPITPAEACFRLGNELMRINRGDSAEPFFLQAEKLAPNSPLPYEGLGLLASQREKPDESIRYLKESLDRGSSSFLAHYAYAQARFHLQGDGQGRFTRLAPDKATEIQGELEKSIALMPSFAPAQELLGFFELVQGDDLAAAEQHMQRAIQLEPENQWYLLSLAQVQLRNRQSDAARRTLAPLRMANADAKLREQAEEQLTEIDRAEARKPPGR